MNRYFQLADDMTIPNRWHLGCAQVADGSEPRLTAAIRFDSSETPKLAVTHAGRVLDFSLSSFAVPIATMKLARAMADVAGDDVQCIPVSIAGQVGMAAVNALRALSCVDEQCSEFVKWTNQDHRADLAGQYRHVSKLVLHGSVLASGAHLFRVEGYPVKLIVSESVKDAMESVGCVGANFIELPVSSAVLPEAAALRK